MKKLLAIMAALSLLTIPFSLYSAESGSQASNPPPISQPLVAEGDFALQLVTALKLGTPTTEAEAEDILASVGIAPKNGWISNYPMTPIVVGEVQDAMIASIDSKKLSMGKEEALRAFQGITAPSDLAIAPALDRSAQAGPPTSGEYVQPPVIDDYYYAEGPPVVTYYPPPWDYNYLYAWVPYPFFCSGVFFPGFFILNDFDVVVANHHFHHGHGFDHHGHDFDHRITNHFRDPKTQDFRRVDPTTRTAGMTMNATATRTAGLKSPDARKGATSIFNRSVQTSRSVGPSGTAGRGLSGATPRTATGRTFSQTGNGGRTFTGSGRSFSTPANRSFSMPSQSFARSFSSPSRSFSAPPMSGGSSFGGIHVGSFGGFVGGSGFSGGFHEGGFHR